MAWKTPVEIFGPGINQFNLYAAVGISLSTWEDAENEIAVLYSVLVGNPRGEAVARLAAENGTFNKRMMAVRCAALEFFNRIHEQRFEGAVDAILAEAEKLASVRHRIAHGVIAPALDFEREKTLPIELRAMRPVTYAVQPPRYGVTKLAKGDPYLHYELFIRDIEAFVRDVEALWTRAHGTAFQLMMLRHARFVAKSGLTEFQLQSRWPVSGLSDILASPAVPEESQPQPQPQPGPDLDK